MLILQEKTGHELSQLVDLVNIVVSVQDTSCDVDFIGGLLD